MHAVAHARYSIGEYLSLEEHSNVKHEFCDGQILAMAGGTPEHARLASGVSAALVLQLSGRRCGVYSADLRIRVRATGLDTYPDVSVVCGQEERDTEDKNAVTNPIVLVEVTSDSTEAYDRGEKFEHYKKIASLRGVVFVSHRAPHIEVWERSAEGWTKREARSGERIQIASIDCTLEVDALYRDPFAQ